VQMMGRGDERIVFAYGGTTLERSSCDRVMPMQSYSMLGPSLEGCSGG
jgi:hypothetical protein